jgi:hypothetical protein
MRNRGRKRDKPHGPIRVGRVRRRESSEGKIVASRLPQREQNGAIRGVQILSVQAETQIDRLLTRTERIPVVLTDHHSIDKLLTPIVAIQTVRDSIAKRTIPIVRLRASTPEAWKITMEDTAASG